MMSIAFTGALAAQRKIRMLHRLDVAENAGTSAAARVLLRDTDQNGPILADVRLIAAESRNIGFVPPLAFPNGLYVQVSAGTVRGSITGS